MFTTLVSKVFDYANAGRAVATLVIASTAASAVAFTSIRINFIVAVYAITSNFRWPIAAASATVTAIRYNAATVTAFPTAAASASYTAIW